MYCLFSTPARWRWRWSWSASDQMLLLQGARFV